MVIHEFWTFLTDIILALLSFFYAFRLKSLLRSPHLSSKLWMPVFISIGLAALSGAIFHGFKPYLPLPIYNSLRILVLFSLSTTAFLIATSLLAFTLRETSVSYRLLQWLLRIKLLIFLGIAVIKTEFIVAIADYGSTFIIALFVFTARHKHQASKPMILAISISLIAAMVQMLKISPHPSFNHNDLYHVVQMLGLYLFYQAAPKMTDRQS